MSTSPRQFTMQELVARTHVSAGTIRYYLSEGVLPPPLRQSTNRFLYDERHVEVIRLVRLLRERKDLSLEAIRQLLPELIPDLLGHPDGGVFNSEMWGELIATRTRLIAGPSVAQRLIAAGVVAFSERGYSDVSVDDVCRATSIAKGSFYRHFDSKEALFFAVARAAGEDVSARIKAKATTAATTPALATKYLVDAILPVIAIFLDLAALAAHGKDDHREVLRQIAIEINGSAAPLLAPGRFEDAFATAFGRAVREVITGNGDLAGNFEAKLQAALH